MKESTKAHGNVGNNSAKKEITADSQIQMRVTREEKAAWVKQAQSQGLKLSAWIRNKLND
jgi:predicted HicB family RNase H-like nuclease